MTGETQKNKTYLFYEVVWGYLTNLFEEKVHNLCLLLHGLRMFWFRLLPATKAPRGRPSPCRRAEENEKKEAETGGSG